MSDDVARLVAVLEANLKGFTKGMDQAQKVADRRFGQIEKRLRQSENVFAGSFKKIGGFLLGGSALVGIERFVSHISDAAGKLQDTSEALGIGTDALQTWGLLAAKAGIGQEALNKALANFSKNLGEAQLKGAKNPMAKLLNSIGVGTKGTPEEVFNRFADAVKNTSNQQQRAALVSELLGQRYVALTGFIQGGSSAIHAQGVEFARTGAIMSTDVIGKIEELNDKWTELKTRFTAIGANVLAGVAGEFSSIVDDITSPEFQEGLKNFGVVMADVAVLVAKTAAGIGTIAGFLGVGAKDEIADLRALIAERKALIEKHGSGQFAKDELARGEARLAELLRQRASKAGIPFAKPGAPKPGIDRTGTLAPDDTDAENAQKVIKKTFAELQAAQADLTKATGRANAKALNSTIAYYDAQRQEIRDTADAAILAAEAKKDAEIAALDRAKLGNAAYATIVDQINQTTAAEQATILEDRRGDLAKIGVQEVEQALATARQIEDIRLDSEGRLADAARSAADAEGELLLEQARKRAEGSVEFFEIQRGLIEKRQKLEEEAIRERLDRDLLDIDRQAEDLTRAGEAWAEYEQTRVNVTTAAEAEIQAVRDKAAAERVRSDKDANDRRLENIDQFFGNLATLSRSSNETLAGIGKAAAIIQATMDGILAVQNALAHVPFPFNIAAAAAVGAAAAVNVAEIAGMEKGGRVQAGTPYIVGEKRPELFVPDTNGTIIPRLPNIASATQGNKTLSMSFTNNNSFAGAVDAASIRAYADQVGVMTADATIKHISRRFPSMMVKAQRDRLP